MAVEGVDYAFPPRPSIAGLAEAGKKFAFRYGGPGSLSKQLDPVEAQTLSAAGIAVVANAEGAADGLLGGWNPGVSWAASAEAHFKKCGMPPGRPIYLSVDFDCPSSRWPSVAAALRGAASVLGAARVGVYGGRRSIEWARRDNVAQWFWQTYAWSGGVWAPGNHCEQYKNGVPLAGGSVDLNRALLPDFGQWTTGDDMTFEQADRNTAIADTWRMLTVLENRDAAEYQLPGEPAPRVETNNLKAQLDRIEAALAQPVSDEQLERVLKKVLRDGVGATPAES